MILGIDLVFHRFSVSLSFWIEITRQEQYIKVRNHNMKEIVDAFAWAKSIKNQPSIIIAHTVKGKGVSYMENVPIWHYRSPNPTEYKEALDHLTQVTS